MRAQIVDLHEIHALRGLKYLHTLWLDENICTKAKDYRKFVIFMLPRICKLDGEEISQEERDAAEAQFTAAPLEPLVPTLNIHGAAVKYSSHLPPRPTGQMVSPRTSSAREPSPKRGLESPRIIIDAPRGPNTGRPASPYIYVQDSPRQIPAPTGETNKHVLSALLSLIKDLNLDGTLYPHVGTNVSLLICVPAAPVFVEVALTILLTSVRVDDDQDGRRLAHPRGCFRRVSHFGQVRSSQTQQKFHKASCTTWHGRVY